MVTKSNWNNTQSDRNAMALNSKCDAVDEFEIIRDIKICVDKIISLKETDNVSRQRMLKDIETLLSTYKQHAFNGDNWGDVVQNIIKILFECLRDKSEKCRELSVKILYSFIDCLSDIQCFVPYISTIFLQRLGKSDERESSEEVRLLEVQLLHKLIDKYDGDLLKYMNDIAEILCMCITDDYPEVKRKACHCTTILAQKQQPNFHLISSSLLKPLLQTISHQHFRTRSVCVRTIGYVVCNGKSQDFEDAITHVAQRLFDHSPVVRTTVTEVIGWWLLMLNDRYSFFNRLIPLILATLYDEVQDIKLKGWDLWNKAGEQYLSENEKDYKDLMDFPRPDPENYPRTEKRPSLGCRILVQRNMFSILPPLIRDLTDWVSETRMKSVQVLYCLILHAEDKATIQLSLFIDGIVSAAKDEEKGVCKMAIWCAEMLGFFLDPNLLCDSVMTLVYKSPCAVNLSIFAAVLRGNKKGLSPKCFQAICKLLSDSSICRVRQAEEQANLLLCTEGILPSHNKTDSIASYQLFTILCSVSGLTTNTSISEKAVSLFILLANKQSCNLESLFKMHSFSLINSLIAGNELWTSQNPELPIFYFLVQSEYTGEDVLKIALPVMTNNLNLNKDVNLRSKVLTLLIKVFKKLPSTQDKELSDKILSLIRFGLFPNLTWSPGKAANSLRTVAIASLYEIVRKDYINDVMLKSTSNEVLPILASLSDDDEMQNRLLSCKILEFLLPKLYGFIDDYKIHSTCHDFLQCMDDSSDDIRISATKVLNSYIKTFPKDYCWSSYRSYLKEVYQNVLIHMDDKNEKVSKSVSDLLKDIAFADPQLLLDEIEEKRYVMAADDYCNNLIEHIRKLKM